MPTAQSNWSLNRVLVLLLTFGCLGLAIDIRFEHTDVVRHHWTAWIPIIYALGMVAAGLLALVVWRPGARRALFWAYALGLAVGLTGFWLHTDGDVLGSLQRVLVAWVHHYDHEDEPPPLAPMAFCGVGLLGMAACAKRFEPKTATP